MPRWIFRDRLAGKANREGPAKPSIWQKVVFCFTKSLPTLYIPYYPQIVRSSFQRENHRKYT